MKKRVAIMFMIVVLAFCLLAAWHHFTKPTEPSYKGRTLTEWLTQPNREIDGAVEQVEEVGVAIRHMGTNAVPPLISWLRTKDARVKGILYEMHERFHLRSVWLSESRKHQLSEALLKLDDTDFEQAALPQLNALTNHPNVEIQSQAQYILRKHEQAKATRQAAEDRMGAILDGRSVPMQNPN
jgi:hypothetical protein